MRRDTGKTKRMNLRWLAAMVSIVMLSPRHAVAQLDETWNVRVNGKVVQVSEKGVFRIPNVSAADNFGLGGPGTPPDFRSDELMRLVGCKTSNGITSYVYSEPFRISSGLTFHITDLTFSQSPPPFPVMIEIEPSQGILLTDIGMSAQLLVNGILVNGDTIVVTSQAANTSYQTSNLAIATIGPNGLVTATGNGSAFITAVNEGATAVVRVIVAIGDPLTTVEGFVQLEDGTPVSGADISFFGLPNTGTSDGVAFFSIAGVPSMVTDTLTVRASATVNDETLRGSSPNLDPVPDGLTDAGIIVLRPVEVEFEDEFGANLFQSDDDFDLINLGFTFPFYGVEYTQLFVGSNGYITFGSGDRDFSESIGEHLSPEPRISPYFDDLDPRFPGPGGGVFVNELDLPKRLVVTWNNLPEFNRASSNQNTIQAVLFEDGRIQFGYRSLSSIDSIVGLSPGSSPSFETVDYSSLTAPQSFGFRIAILEQFTSSNFFDMENAFVVFEPSGDAAYDVSFFPPSAALAALKTARTTRHIAEGLIGELTSTKILAGETMTPSGRTLNDGSLFVKDGATLKLDSPFTTLVVNNLVLMDGSTLIWESGTIIVDGGILKSNEDLFIGTTGQAKLVLVNGARVRAPSLNIPMTGELTGEGVVIANVTNSGLIRPEGDGIEIEGQYRQELEGVLSIVLDEDPILALEPKLRITLNADLDGSTYLGVPTDDTVPAGFAFGLLRAFSINGNFRASLGVRHELSNVANSELWGTVLALCPGDTTGGIMGAADGFVDEADLLALLAAWGNHDPSLDLAGGDGIIGVQDLIAVLAAWGACP